MLLQDFSANFEVTDFQISGKLALLSKCLLYVQKVTNSGREIAHKPLSKSVMVS